MMSKNSIVPFLKDYLIKFLTRPFLLDTNDIGNNLFGDYGVSDIYIPKSVEIIEPFAFDHNVKNIFVQKGETDKVKAMLPSTYHKCIQERSKFLFV